MKRKPRQLRSLSAGVAVPLVALATLALLAGAAAAVPNDATPIGPLPDGPVSTVATERGTLVAVALPRQPASSGLVWRVARQVKTSVLKQVSEADVGASVVVVFRAVGRGKAQIVFAATKGDASPKAVKSATYRVTVS